MMDKCFYCGAGPFEDVKGWALHKCKSKYDLANDNKQLRAELAAAQKRIAELEGNNISIGKWLSAALEDSKVCKEMKEDINNWFSAFEPKKEDKQKGER